VSPAAVGPRAARCTDKPSRYIRQFLASIQTSTFHKQIYYVWGASVTPTCAVVNSVWLFLEVQVIQRHIAGLSYTTLPSLSLVCVTLRETRHSTATRYLELSSFVSHTFLDIIGMNKRHPLLYFIFINRNDPDIFQSGLRNFKPSRSSSSSSSNSSVNQWNYWTSWRFSVRGLDTDRPSERRC
jgi:hypothetical protein